MREISIVCLQIVLHRVPLFSCLSLLMVVQINTLPLQAQTFARNQLFQEGCTSRDPMDFSETRLIFAHHKMHKNYNKCKLISWQMNTIVRESHAGITLMLRAAVDCVVQTSSLKSK